MKKYSVTKFKTFKTAAKVMFLNVLNSFFAYSIRAQSEAKF